MEQTVGRVTYSSNGPARDVLNILGNPSTDGLPDKTILGHPAYSIERRDCQEFRRLVPKICAENSQ